MDKAERIKKLEEHMKSTTIVIKADDFAKIASMAIAEEPFASLIKEDPTVFMTLMMFTSEILSKLVPNPFKEEDESEDN